MSASDMRYGNPGQGAQGAPQANNPQPSRAPLPGDAASVRSYGMGSANPGAAHAAPGSYPASGGYAASAGQRTPGQAPYGGYPSFGQVPHTAGPGYPAPATYQVPLTSQPQTLAPNKSRKGVVIGCVIALVAIVVAILLALTLCTDERSRRQGDAGQLAGKTDAEIQAELDRVVEEGMFNISIASVIELESGTSEGDLRIENVPGNRYLMRVTLLRNDTGEQLYQTDVIEPDHHIQRDALDVALPQGSYECTALFEALDPESEEQVGQAAAIVTVNVRS